MQNPTRPPSLLATLLRLRAFKPLRYREYRLLWFGQIFGSMGMWMDEVTRGWLIHELTDSALQLGRPPAVRRRLYIRRSGRSAGLPALRPWGLR